MKLADLMYGHGSKFICSLSGRFNPEKYPDAPPIQICEMKCGCWIVTDGNNRVGLVPQTAAARHLQKVRTFGRWDCITREFFDGGVPNARSLNRRQMKLSGP